MSTTSVELPTVVVPVHGGGTIVDRCLKSVLAHTDLTAARLLVVVDGDPSFGERTMAATLARTVGAEVVEHPQRRGFAAAANWAFAATRGDVVLLNSDVLVAAGWLDNLTEAARSRPNVATVTPWSNDATLCSWPRPFVTNPLPPGLGVDEVAARIARLSQRRRPQIPTGVGSCLLIRREALEVVGGFDVDAFGLGYGEEVDFCLRAAAAGFVHLLDDATFVFHRGQSSFGFARTPQVAAAERIVARRHPGYRAAIAAAMAEDPTAGARADLASKVADAHRARPARVLHVVHGYPPWSRAGTEIYAERLATHQAAFREVAVHTRVGGSGAPHGAGVDQADPDRSLVVRAVANDFSARNPLVRNAIRDPIMAADLGRALDRFRPELVHLHHLAGHGLAAADEVVRRRLPLVIQLQDWWLLCARANLLDADRRLCPGPHFQRCAACLPLTRVAPSRWWSALLHRARAARARRLLAAADLLVMGSEAIRTSFASLGWLPPGVRTEVLDYGTPTASALPREPWNGRRPLRLGFVGSILPHKGLHLALTAMAGLDPGRIELEIWGDPSIDAEYHRELLGLAGANVRWCGRFEEARREQVFARFDLMLVPSLGLESYGLLVREAFARGIPVLASDRGALPEAFPHPAPGRVLAAENPEAWQRALEDVLREPQVLEQWRTAIPDQTPAADHAEAIERLYREVLERHSR